MLLRNGNQICNWLRLVSPCTMRTGIKNSAVRRKHATATPSLDIHLCINVEEKKGQYTSWGSGACSVTQWMGLFDCCICIAIAAP